MRDFRRSNISYTTKKVDLMPNPNPGAVDRGKRNGQPQRPAPGYHRLLDHHLEELLEMFGDAPVVREAPGTGEKRPG
jgi:hypothetical protein